MCVVRTIDQLSYPFSKLTTSLTAWRFGDFFREVDLPRGPGG